MPASLFIKPASGNCNMNCKYCFYVDEMKNRKTSSYGTMSLNTLEAIVEKSLKSAGRSFMFSFQGGEPTLAGLDFFNHLISFEKKYKKPNQTIHHSLQTNGYALNEEWAEFFAKNNFLVGLSLDGNKDIHDANRQDYLNRDTFKKVMKTAELFKSKGVEFNILTVVTPKNARHAKQVYSFFKKNGLKYQQYIPCLPPLGENNIQKDCLTPEQYGIFLKDLFQQWYIDKKNGNNIYIRYFENLLQMLAGYPPEACGLSGNCCNQWVVEADGGVYTCDFYVLDKWMLGNFNTNSVEEIEKNPIVSEFINLSKEIPQKCQKCKWFDLCHGGCKRERTTDENGSLTNMFCDGYKDFFEFAVPKLVEILRNFQR